MNERDRRLIEEGKRQIIESLTAPPAPWWLKALFFPGAMILLLSLRVRDSVWFIGDTMALLFVMAAIAAVSGLVLNTLWAFIKMVSQ